MVFCMIGAGHTQHCLHFGLTHHAYATAKALCTDECHHPSPTLLLHRRLTSSLLGQLSSCRSTLRTPAVPVQRWGHTRRHPTAHAGLLYLLHQAKGCQQAPSSQCSAPRAAKRRLS